MASNSPFMAEDTDEDFFDKLVNDDDDDYNNPPTLSSKEESTIVDDNDSDDAKAFANMSINDAGTGPEDLEKVGIGEEDNKDFSSINNDFKHKSANSTHVEPNRLVYSNSFAFDSVNGEPDNGANQLEELLDSSVSKNHESGDTGGVKEVQWSAFGSDSVENSHNAFGSYPDFFNEFEDHSVDQVRKEDNFSSSESNSLVNNSLPVKYVNDYSHQLQEDQAYATTGEQDSNGQDPNSSQYQENPYPGWSYDANTGQWYHVSENYNATQGENNTDISSDWISSNQKSEVSYLQQSTQTVVEAVVEKGTTESITNWNSGDNNESLSNWNQGSLDNSNNVYPAHMVFDPQYPGWYYDTIIQDWHSLDDYSSQSTVVAQEPVNQNGFGQRNNYYGNDQKTYSEHQDQKNNWNGSLSNSGQQSSSMWQPNIVANSTPMEDLRNNEQLANHYGNNLHVNQQQFYDYVGTATQVNNGFPKSYGNQNQLSYLQQQVQSGHQVSYESAAGRSSAGRPPHALVTFGFGGKLIVMKDNNDLINASYGGQDSNRGSLSVLNLEEVVTGGGRVHEYFHTLCQHSLPGPLSGGNVGGKELNKWIDERITHFETSDVDYSKGEVVRLLLSLLKIACQHYGKFRSPFGSDTSIKENDAPEVAVARLFASVKNSAEYTNYGTFGNCLQQIPSEGQTWETAAEVQTLLVSGRKKEALLRAQEGQLWGPALVLAAQLGDQFYVDTVKKMAIQQLVPGSPLRTLCLLIAGQPADVFAANATTEGVVPGPVNLSQQPTQGNLSANGMLDDWEDNLAVITANRTKDDELVLIHLGDCLCKERSNIIAAHICYLVAEANFEPYSDSARLCLIGADHWKNPRTYASPEAIQRTEVYEYSKMLGNSQFTLLPFQPYKLIYAHMLAEVGRVSDSLKYCHAVTKSLKTGRIPEVETWRQLVISLEDRIKTHQQGGFSTNLAAGKIVGKLLNLFDSTAHRVVGGLPPPVPSTNDHHHQQLKAPTPRVMTSQSTMAMSSLVPSASMEPINQADGNSRRMMHNRSASEPDFGRRDQDGTLKENSADSQSKTSGNTSRFGRFSFGSGLFQKTVGMVLKPRQDKQAKLGDSNKFYYDEKLKRWVEEGVDPPAEESVLRPPPTMAAFQNGTPDYSLKSALRTESFSSGSVEFASPTPASNTSGIPPIPATSNQFSARGRTGVRARYVDTFNQGGGNPTNLFQSPSVSIIKPPKTNPNPKFFVPTASPAAAEQPAANIIPENMQQNIIPDNQRPSFSSKSSPSAMGLPKHASMDDMSKRVTLTSSSTSSSSSFINQPMSRRTVSWSESANENFSVSGNSEFKPFVGMPTHSSNDDLQEVEL